MPIRYVASKLRGLVRRRTEVIDTKDVEPEEFYLRLRTADGNLADFVVEYSEIIIAALEKERL